MGDNSWNIEKANKLYGIDRWGLGYFTVNEAGNVCVKPSADSPFKVDIKLLIDELRKRNIHTPVLVRVMDILKDRLHKITDCFRTAIKDNDYKGAYNPLFPIKVNQERMWLLLFSVTEKNWAWVWKRDPKPNS